MGGILATVSWALACEIHDSGTYIFSVKSNCTETSSSVQSGKSAFGQKQGRAMLFF